MKNKKIFLICLAIAVFLLVIFLYPLFQLNTITNFEECVATGNPVMESYPRQCYDPISNQTFTEEIIIGGDTDEHGCLIPAGYLWNEDLGICVRPWEIKNNTFSPTECLEKGGRTQNIVAGDYCYENETNIGIVVGFISPNVCCVENIPCPEIQGEFCIEIYQPVCGVQDKQTHSNSCFACLNSTINTHYIEGECQ